MLNEMLDVWRTLPGAMRLDVAPVVFAKVVDRALWAAQPVGHAAGVRVTRQIEPSAAQLVGADAKRLTQAFLMLICNVMASLDEAASSSCMHRVRRAPRICGSADTVRLPLWLARLIVLV
jgi:hypothetical protein